MENDQEFDSLLNELQSDLETEKRIFSSAGKKVLKLAREFKDSGETIIKLVSTRWFVQSDANLLDLADDLTNDSDIQAVGIVDDNGRCTGLVQRRDLFDQLSRPFGRDVMRSALVEKVAYNSERFYYDTSIFSISERLKQLNQRDEVMFFPLISGSGEFAGIFSSQDLLIYLSDLTQQDINLARNIQSRVVREFSYLNKDNFELCGSSTMAKGVGGDFYSIVNYGPERWFMTLCDVSGKGVAASLLTTALWGTIKTFDKRRGIARLVSTLNDFFLSTFEMEKFVTGVFFDLDSVSGTINIADMGHGLAFILREDRLLKIKSHESNYPIGVMEELTPQVFRYHLDPGDLLLLISDGIIEQENNQGEEFGLKRLKDYLSTHQKENLKDVRRGLLEEFNRFRGQTALHDDVTLLMLRWKSTQASR